MRTGQEIFGSNYIVEDVIAFLFGGQIRALLTISVQKTGLAYLHIGNWTPAISICYAIQLPDYTYFKSNSRVKPLMKCTAS